MTESAPPSFDPERIPHVHANDVGAKARRGAMWSAVQIVTRNVVSIGVTAVLARLLVPADYGLIGMVTTLTALLLVFSDMGLSWATVQRRDLNNAQVSSLFWVNIAAGVVLWGAMIAAAPFLAAFYGEPALTMITIVSGIGFAISGVAVQPMALLMRQMDFRRIAVIEVTALLVGAVVALALALFDAGYWALVVQGPTQAIVRAILSIHLSGIRLQAPRRTAGLGSLVSFGGLLAVNGVLIYLARNLDSVLIGKVWGAAELGIYNRAYFLMLLPSMLANGVLSGLMVTSLAAFQGDSDRFAQAYRKALRLVAYAGTPMALGLALTAAPAVELIYGPGWDEVVALLGWLSFAAITQPVYNTNGWLFTAAGRGGSYLMLTAVNTGLLGLVFLLTVHNGVQTLAQGYGLVMGLIIPLPALWLAHRAARIPLIPSLRSIFPVYLLNGVMGLLVWATWFVAEAVGWSRMAAFPVQVGVGVISYLILTPLSLRDMMRNDIRPLLVRLNRKADHGG
jgi:O-antigen/teichoic acid export membrane protein